MNLLWTHYVSLIPTSHLNVSSTNICWHTVVVKKIIESFETQALDTLDTDSKALYRNVDAKDVH